MDNRVFIIEAPNKIKKIKDITKSDVFATAGHFKQLSKEKWINFDTYEPSFDFIEDKKSNIDFYLRYCKDKDIYIATDPDREGVAIGFFFYHLVKNIAKSVKRVEFHEITETGIKKGLENAIPFSEVNTKIFEAFKARVVGDKLVGYILSPRLSSLMSERGLSVGRVQTPALKFIVDREIEIEEFLALPKEEKVQFKARIRIKVNDKELTLDNSNLFKTESQLKEELKNFFDGEVAKCIIEKMEKKEIITNAEKPFQAVTLIKRANEKFGFSSEKTMQLAQNLYEKGLITYHRTDAENLSQEFLQEAKSIFEKEEWYSYVEYKAGKHSQAEAHEAIRITHINTIEEIEKIFATENLSQEHLNLYLLIYQNSIFSQSKPIRKEQINIEARAGVLIFKTKVAKIIYKSYKDSEIFKSISINKIKEKDDEIFIDNFQIKEQDEIDILQKEIAEVKAKAPSRYKESDFIPLLQKEGIGRPSTYHTFIKKLTERGYIELKEKDKREEIFATEKGKKVIKTLLEKEEWITNPIFTKEMEEVLDKIIIGEKSYLDFIKPLHSKMGNETFEEKRILKPTEKQIKLMEELSLKLNLELPQEVKENMQLASKWLDKAFKLNKFKPTEKQIALAKKISNEKKIDLPKDFDIDLDICKKFIERNIKK